MAMAAVSLVSLSAMAEPGDGINVGNTVISPFAELVGRYDSNVFQTNKDTKDDFYADGAIGLALKNKTEQLELMGRIWGQARRYDDVEGRDADDWGQSLGALFGQREMLAVALYQRYAQLDDYDRTPGSVDRMNLSEVALDLTGDRADRAKRNVFDVKAGLGKVVTDKVELDMTYAFSDVDYKETGLYDWKEHRGELAGRYNLTDKTAALLVGELGLQDSKGLEDDSKSGVARVGIDHKLTAKTSLRAEGGYEHYNSGATGESSIDMINYRLRGSWDASDRLTIKVVGQNGIFPASIYAQNVKRQARLSLGGYYALTEAVFVSLSGSVSDEKYESKVARGDELVEDKTTYVGGQFRVDYQPPVKFFNLYASVSYLDADSSIEDYQRWRAALGLQMRY